MDPVASFTVDETRKIVKIHITRMTESCERITYFVVLTTDEGFTMEVQSYATGSTYNDFKGLSEAEALDRAITDADHWGDFLRITPTPYIKNGVEIRPTMPLEIYALQREEREEKQDGSTT